eukprot:1148663-Pelagomonas_calceolata.AAC.18
MLVERVPPATDQPKFQAAGQPLVNLDCFIRQAIIFFKVMRVLGCLIGSKPAGEHGVTGKA